MKKLLSVLLCIIMCFAFASCGFEADIGTTDSNADQKETTSNTESDIGTTDSNADQKETTSNTESDNIVLLEQDGVKISFCGVSADIGIGEGIYLLVENFRTENIVVQIQEVSLNDTMQAVIQPQMPMHLTSPNKKSKNAYIFTNVAKLEGQAQFKIIVRSEEFEEIFVSDFVEIIF